MGANQNHYKNNDEAAVFRKYSKNSGKIMAQFGRRSDFKLENRKIIMIEAWQIHHKSAESYD